MTGSRDDVFTQYLRAARRAIDAIESTIRDNAIVTFIRRKFRSLFKEEFAGEGIVFKGEMAKAGRLKLADIHADGAWLRLGWNMTQEGASLAVAAGGE